MFVIVKKVSYHLGNRRGPPDISLAVSEVSGPGAIGAVEFEIIGDI